MSEIMEVTFASLLNEVPSLLQACVARNVDARRLRLVSKEISRVVLQGLTSYAVSLKGVATDTNVDGARLLQQTCLHELSVCLHLTGLYTPAVLLQAFVQQVGTALCSVRNLKLSLIDSGGSKNATAVLCSALELLMETCPVLKSISFEGQLPLSLLQCLSESCPMITALKLCSSVKDLSHVQLVINLLPSVLPKVRHLELPGLRWLEALPDMTHSSITSLDIPRLHLSPVNHWLSLPPNLQNLACNSLTSESAASCDKPILLSLVTVTLCGTYVSIEAVAQLLCSAPNLKHLQVEAAGWTGYGCIDCVFLADNTDNLLLLQSRMATGLVVHAKIAIQPEADLLMKPLFVNFPPMSHVKTCSIDHEIPADLEHLLRIFPDVQELWLFHQELIDDILLQDVSICSQLTTLTLSDCRIITPMGLVVLCMRLPKLRYVTIFYCDLINKNSMESAEALLKRHSLDGEVRFTYNPR